MTQDRQQNMLKGLRAGGGDMMPGSQQYQQMMRMNQMNGGGMNLNQGDLRQKALQNNRNA